MELWDWKDEREYYVFILSLIPHIKYINIEYETRGTLPGAPPFLYLDDSMHSKRTVHFILKRN